MILLKYCLYFLASTLPVLLKLKKERQFSTAAELNVHVYLYESWSSAVALEPIIGTPLSANV